MNQNRFDLITGVGRGLNASLARRFARGGFAVGLTARRSNFIDDLPRKIANGGGHAIALGGWLALAARSSLCVARCNRSRASSGRRVRTSRTWSWTALSARRVSRPSVANRSSIQITCPDVGTGFASAT